MNRHEDEAEGKGLRLLVGPNDDPTRRWTITISVPFDPRRPIQAHVRNEQTGNEHEEESDPFDYVHESWVRQLSDARDQAVGELFASVRDSFDQV